MIGMHLAWRKFLGALGEFRALGPHWGPAPFSRSKVETEAKLMADLAKLYRYPYNFHP
jgi:hypothetical protein